MTDQYRPQVRSDGLLIETVDDELLVWDNELNQAHALNASSARIWRICDGSRGLKELSEQSGLSEEAVQLAIDQLQERNLLVGPTSEGLSRRAVLRGGALAGAGVGLGLALPMIRSIVVPTPAMAATVPGGGPTGPTGPTGFTGLTGPTGPIGPTGATGPF
jgi:hypothetical protein